MPTWVVVPQGAEHVVDRGAVSTEQRLGWCWYRLQFLEKPRLFVEALWFCVDTFLFSAD